MNEKQINSIVANVTMGLLICIIQIGLICLMVSSTYEHYELTKLLLLINASEFAVLFILFGAGNFPYKSKD